MLAVLAILVFLTVMGLIVRAASYALVETGMTEDAARFQSWSALTGTGFTTREAELMVAHPVRRRVTLGLMILGAAGFVTVLSSSAYTFLTAGTTGSVVSRAFWMAVGLAGLVVVARSRALDRWMRRITRRRVRAWVAAGGRQVVLVELGAGNVVAGVVVAPDGRLVGCEVGQVGRDLSPGVVLGLRATDGTYLDVPDEGRRLVVGDVLVVHGDRARIREVCGSVDG